MKSLGLHTTTWLSLLLSLTHVPLYTEAIIEGELVNYYQYPFYALIQQEPPDAPITYCGGTLVASDLVITAASCFRSDLLSSASKVWVGAVDLNSDDKGDAELVGIVGLYPDSRYDYATGEGPNIMLIKIEKVTKDHIKPIKINQDPFYPADGTELRFVGVGQTKGNDPLSRSDDLLYADAVLLTQTTCAANFPLFDSTWEICADDIGFGVNAYCFGDQGGPLFDKGTPNNKKKLIGVQGLPTGTTCDPDRPNVFTSVSSLNLRTRICQLTNHPNSVKYLDCPKSNRSEAGCKKQGVKCDKSIDFDCCDSEGLVCGKKRANQTPKCMKCKKNKQQCGPGYAPCCSTLECKSVGKKGVKKCRKSKK